MASRTTIGSALLTVSLALALSGTASAADGDTSRSARSIDYAQSAALDETARSELLEQAEDSEAGALETQGFRPEAGPVGVTVEVVTYHTGETWLYDASTELISDLNDDGFYHRFSVAIDADTSFDKAWVYAVLYLSYEGGPWNYLTTSNDYPVYGDRTDDTFVIETELADGFPPGYYDIRIELHDAQHGDWLHSYGPYDDSSLSALPLEDSDYDATYYTSGYTTEVVVARQGSMSLWLLSLPLMIGLGRYVSRKDNG